MLKPALALALAVTCSVAVPAHATESLRPIAVAAFKAHSKEAGVRGTHAWNLVRASGRIAKNAIKGGLVFGTSFAAGAGIWLSRPVEGAVAGFITGATLTANAKHELAVARQETVDHSVATGKLDRGTAIVWDRFGLYDAAKP